jgi:hypothetical protein
MSAKGRIVEHMENEIENVGVTNDNGDINEHASVRCTYPIIKNDIVYCCILRGLFNLKNCSKLKGQLPPPKFSYDASCTTSPGNISTNCKCDPAAKGYKLEYNVCKPDSTVKACPIVNKKQLKLGSKGLCV